MPFPLLNAPLCRELACNDRCVRRAVTVGNFKTHVEGEDTDLKYFGQGAFRNHLMEEMQYCVCCDEYNINKLHAVHILPDALSEDITSSDLEVLNAKLKNYPNYWGIIGNCATFAFSMWNSVTGDAYFSLLLPAISDFMIMVGGGKRGELEMHCPSRDRVYRQKGSGDNGYLEGVSDYTVS